MALQYVQDTGGKTTAVIIPIEEWKLIVSKHDDLKLLEESKKTVKRNNIKPSDLAGSLSEESYHALNEHIKQSRNEWDREIF